jgi:dienelactone hydrolase
MNKISWGWLLVVLVTLAGIVYYKQGRQEQSMISDLTAETTVVADEINEVSEEVSEIVEEPTGELSIPALRMQNYQSQLELLAVVEETAKYQAWQGQFIVEGHRENGLLVLPTGVADLGGWPVVILVHGYVDPVGYRTNGTPYHHWWQGLVERGKLAIFKIDLRGHDQSEGESVSTYYDSGYVRDILYAYQALSNRPEINRQKIGLWSHSSAGNLVLRASVVAQNIPAVSIWGGAIFTYDDFCWWGQSDGSKIPNPLSWQEATARSDPAYYRLVEAHQRGECGDFWGQVSPTNYLGGVKTSFQLQHAVSDETINFTYAQNLASILEEAGIKTQLVRYEYGDHNFNGILSSALESMETFFINEFGFENL